MHIIVIINKYFRQMMQWCHQTASFHKKTNLPAFTRYKVTLYTRHVFFAHVPFQTHDPTQPTKHKNFRPIPNPTQPNQRVNPTHGQLWGKLMTLPHSPSWMRRGYPWRDTLPLPCSPPPQFTYKVKLTIFDSTLFVLNNFMNKRLDVKSNNLFNCRPNWHDKA